MPKSKFQTSTQKGECPVCKGITLVSKVRHHRSQALVQQITECRNLMCGYYFSSEHGHFHEMIGATSLSSSTPFADGPGMWRTWKWLKQYRKVRKKLILEVQALMVDPEAKMILECLISPNANKDGLKLTLRDWLKKHKKTYPEYYRSLKMRIKYEGIAARRREGREEDRDGDDNQQGSPVRNR